MTLNLDAICRTRLHCFACRTDPDQRRRVGLPDVCPQGFTAEDLPQPAAARVVPAYVAERRLACGIGKPPREWCDELDNPGVICELMLDEALASRAKPCECGKRMTAFLNDPASECPRKTWGPADRSKQETARGSEPQRPTR